MPIIDSRYGVYIKDTKPIRVCQWSDCPDAGGGYEGRKMKMCAKCNVVRYCSKACQRSDWSEHKLYCQIPPLMDIGEWMETHEALFRWAVIEGLRLRSEPSNIVDHGLLVQLTRMDRLLKGVAPSPFLVESIQIKPLAAMQKILRLPHDIFTGNSREVVEAGGIGKGVVVFLTSAGDGSMVLRFQYHEIHEKPQGVESPSRTGWENVVKGVVNGEIPISLLSQRIEASNASE
ncbi:hypothetical protein K438DRAFT_1929926 [Mycena galopus ATCC 62051]|nr:hypothetical protein K438DRAFT_1929926 [Mycena galopus ATCC 62051]